MRQSLMASGVVLGTDRFIGWSNYVALAQSPAFWHSLGVTVLFSLIINPLQTAAALALALLVFRQGPGIGAFRTIFFLPMTVSIVITSLIWRLILDTPTQGWRTACSRRPACRHSRS
jgi:multiple sugar transport system permease protein